MGKVDFSDFDAAKAWFETRTPQERSLVTSRAALRILANISQIEGARFESLARPVFWAVLISAVRGSGRTADMDGDSASLSADSAARSAARSSADSADSAARSASSAARSALSAASSAARSALSAARSADSAALSAARSAAARSARSAARSADSAARSADSAARSADSATSADAVAVEEQTELAGVWGLNEVPEAIQTNRIAFIDRLKADVRWDFFRRWYEEMWDGTWTDWDLAHEVAKIDASVWEYGLDAVAAEIEAIEERLLSERLPQADRVVFDADTGKFTREARAIANAGLLEATLVQLEDALEDVLAEPSNGLNERSGEVIKLRRVLSRYRNNAQQIEMTCVRVHANLTEKIVKGELPPSDGLMELKSIADEVGVGIRATDAEVAGYRETLNKRRFEELGPDQKEQLQNALPMVIAISDEPLAEDWGQDYPEVINTSLGPLPTGAPALPGMDAATRIFKGAADMSIAVKSKKVMDAVEKSSGYKATTIALTLHGLVDLGLKLLAFVGLGK